MDVNCNKSVVYQFAVLQAIYNDWCEPIREIPSVISSLGLIVLSTLK